VGAIELYTVRAGPAHGPAVFLLHDFAQFWGQWAGQIGALARAGFRVVVPDQRGHDRSDRPDSPDAYPVQVLAGDIAALIRNTGHRRVSLVGHGAGATVAWEVALLYPARLEKLVILSAPHPAVSPEPGGRGGWSRRIASSPQLQGEGAGAEDALVALLGTTARGTAFSNPDLETLRTSWRRSGSIAGMLNWYRALSTLERSPLELADPRIDVPSLLLWGQDDSVYPAELAERSLSFLSDGELRTLPGAGHWLPQEATEEVNRNLLEFLEPR